MEKEMCYVGEQTARDYVHDEVFKYCSERDIDVDICSDRSEYSSEFIFKFIPGFTYRLTIPNERIYQFPVETVNKIKECLKEQCSMTMAKSLFIDELKRYCEKLGLTYDITDFISDIGCCVRHVGGWLIANNKMTFDKLNEVKKSIYASYKKSLDVNNNTKEKETMEKRYFTDEQYCEMFKMEGVNEFTNRFNMLRIVPTMRSLDEFCYKHHLNVNVTRSDVVNNRFTISVTNCRGWGIDSTIHARALNGAWANYFVWKINEYFNLHDDVLIFVPVDTFINRVRCYCKALGFDINVMKETGIVSEEVFVSFDITTKRGVERISVRSWSMYGRTLNLTCDRIRSLVDGRHYTPVMTENERLHNPSWHNLNRLVVADITRKYESENAKKSGTFGIMPTVTIKDVIFNGPATIVFWSDNTKTVVKQRGGDPMDKEKGLAMAISKKFMGTGEKHEDYYDIFKKWIPNEKERGPVVKKPWERF